MQEQGFDVRGGGVMEDIAGDIRLALRILRKRPVKTAALAATVALGIGINTAVFSVMKAVVLDPLPFAKAKELMVIHQVVKGESEGVSYPNFEDWRGASRSFDAMAVYAADSSTLTEDGQARRVSGAVVSADMFRLLRVTPLPYNLEVRQFKEEIAHVQADNPARFRSCPGAYTGARTR